ncbi:DUF2182 domain-containing protein [Pseudonocardia sp. C8]|uniref:DUF2182 domain-containing protein n=1 Tax=Pseudonocardia sp. C8 TaxID=2762759 RepID=UPI002102CDC6|nr:DUF2182 domain-containing protein [Pseudonocardia sp. C8]
MMSVLVGLAAVSGLACWWYVTEQRHAHGTELSLAALGRYLIMWSTMMAAMMLPTVHRTTILYVRAIRDQTPSKAWSVRLGALLFGYLVIWSLIGVPVYFVNVVVQKVIPNDTHAMAWFTAALLVAGGLFQFSTLKERCLRHCQSPVGFVAEYMTRTSWDRDLRAGIAHGVTCLGCCTAMVVVLIAVGTMSLPAMIVLGVIAMIEKTWARGAAFSRIMGVGLILYAAVIVVNPQWSPAPFGDTGDHAPVSVGHHHHQNGYG